MVTATEIAASLQRLGPTLFDGSSQTVNNIELSAARTNFRGLAVAVPAQVSTDTQSVVPVVVLSQQTMLRAWQVPEAYNLMLAVTDVDSGNLRLSRALVDPKDGEAPATMPAPRPPAPTGNSAAAVSTKVHRIELPAQPGLTAHLAVAVISFDNVSNTASVMLAGSRPKPAPPVRPIAPMPNAVQGLPTYSATDRGPKPPPEGLVFELELPGSAPSTIVVRGAFSKPLAAHEQLPSPQTVRDNGVDKQATAVVPLTLAVLGLDWKAPRMHTLAAAVYGPHDLPLGQRLSGQFAATVPIGVTLPAGDYVAYVLMDGVPYGPRKFAVK